MSKYVSCPDCGVVVGELHHEGCDVEHCYHCGLQALGCESFDLDDARRRPWSGRWPGDEDCERLGLFIANNPELPDLNRLVMECRWNAKKQHWERR